MATHKGTGYAYVILFSCVMLRLVETCATMTFGLYVLEFLEYFHTTNTFSIASLGGLYLFGQAIAGPVAGISVRRFGARITAGGCSLLSATSLLMAGSFPSLQVLTVNYIVTGLCSQGMLIAGQVVVQQYFDKKRSLAAGINMSGSSWGHLCYPPLIRYLIDTFTWRGSYYIYAGIVGNGIVFASLLRPAPFKDPTAKEPAKTVKIETNKERKRENKCQLKYLNWFLYLFGVFLLGTGHFAAPVYFPMKAHNARINTKDIPFLISAIGLTGIFMRPLAGFLGDLKYVDRLILSAIGVGLSGISLIIATQVTGFTSLMSIAVMVGILQSCYIGPAGAQVVDVFTLENVEKGAGLFSLSFGMGLCVINPIAGLLIDLTGTTDSVFYVFGSAQVCSGIILAIVSQITRHLNKNIRKEVPNDAELVETAHSEAIKT